MLETIQRRYNDRSSYPPARFHESTIMCRAAIAAALVWLGLSLDWTAARAEEAAPTGGVLSTSIAQLVDELDSPHFATREAAGNALEKIGAPPHDALRAAVAMPASAEVKRRAEKILAAIRL